MNKKNKGQGSEEQTRRRNIILLSVAGSLLVIAGLVVWLRSDTTPETPPQVEVDAQKIVEQIKKDQKQPLPEPPMPTERGSARRPVQGR